MIDPSKITPLLDRTTVEQEIGHGPNGTVYLVSRWKDGKKLALKHISIPASDAQTKALIFAGAVSGEADAQRYYNSLLGEIKSEILAIKSIKDSSSLLRILGYQVDQKFTGLGYDVYILADYFPSLPDCLERNTITKLQALNLAIDLCSALEQLRSAGLIHKDVRPSNIFYGSNHHFLLGDLGVVKRSDLSYSTMPDNLVTSYTAPEVIPADATLSDTMDIYSVGMILYEIYNGGTLPEEAEDELPPPAYADLTMAEIILKACALAPEDRYQTPHEMKQALVLHLQRGNISNTPLVPASADEESEVDVAAIAATVEAGQEAEGVVPSPEDTPAESSEEVPEEPENPVEPEGPDDIPLDQLADNDLLVETQEGISVEDFLASVRGIPGLEVVSLDENGKTTTVPGYETEETLPADTQYVDSADKRPEEPESPDTFDEPEAETDSVPAPDAPAELPEEAPAQEPVPQAPPRPRRVFVPTPKDNVNVYDDGYDDGYESPEEYGDEEYYDDEEAPGAAWKKVLISVIVLLVLAGGAFALYMFKTDTVQTMSTQVLSASSVEVQAGLKNSTAAEVVCSTPTGEVARVPLTDGSAVFTGLSPSTSYTFTMESTAGKFLLGSKRMDARTNQMTNINGFAARSVGAVSAELAITGTGSPPDTWIVTVTSDSGEEITAESSDYIISVEGLTPETTYTATIARGDGDDLSGATTCTFTTMVYTTLSSFEISDVSTSSMALQWSYSGTIPESWDVLCEGTDGSSTTISVSGTECSFDGLTPGVTYTVTLSCDSLKATDLDTVSVAIPDVTITEITSVQNDDGNIEVSWEYTGNRTPSQWGISYAYVSDVAVTPTLVTSDTTSVVLEDLIPGATYQITIVSADEYGVGGTAETSCVTEDAEPYTNYNCHDTSMFLYATGDEDRTPVTSFAMGDSISFLIEASYDETEEEKSAIPLYVIRNASGNPVYVYESSSGRTWRGEWLTAKHTGDMPDLDLQPGSYTLEVYFDGGLLAETDFSISG